MIIDLPGRGGYRAARAGRAASIGRSRSRRAFGGSAERIIYCATRDELRHFNAQPAGDMLVVLAVLIELGRAEADLVEPICAVDEEDACFDLLTPLLPWES